MWPPEPRRVAFTGRLNSPLAAKPLNCAKGTGSPCTISLTATVVVAGNAAVDSPWLNRLPQPKSFRSTPLAPAMTPDEVEARLDCEPRPFLAALLAAVLPAVAPPASPPTKPVNWTCTLGSDGAV